MLTVTWTRLRGRGVDLSVCATVDTERWVREYSQDSACGLSAHRFCSHGSLDLRHPHGEALDHHMGVEGLQHISRHQTVVYALIFVLLQLRELVLSYIHHVSGASCLDVCRGCGGEGVKGDVTVAATNSQGFLFRV